MFLSLYSDNLIMLEFRDIWEKDCCVCSRCVCSYERREKELFFLIEMYDFFLSRKIHLESVATSKIIWKSFAFRESVGV